MGSRIHQNVFVFSSSGPNVTCTWLLLFDCLSLSDASSRFVELLRHRRVTFCIQIKALLMASQGIVFLVETPPRTLRLITPLTFPSKLIDTYLMLLITIHLKLERSARRLFASLLVYGPLLCENLINCCFVPSVLCAENKNSIHVKQKLRPTGNENCTDKTFV